MAHTPFDPSEAITFDLAYGHVHLDGAPNRVLVPGEELLTLCQAAGDEPTAALARAIGTAIGHRVAVRLAPGAEDRHEVVGAAPFEAVIEELAGEIALCGLGALSGERWGRALVLIHDQSPLGSGGDPLLGAILQEAIQEACGQVGRAVLLERNGVRARFLLVAEQSAEPVRQRLREGTSWGAVLSMLHPEGPPI